MQSRLMSKWRWRKVVWSSSRSRITAPASGYDCLSVRSVHGASLCSAGFVSFSISSPFVFNIERRHGYSVWTVYHQQAAEFWGPFCYFHLWFQRGGELRHMRYCITNMYSLCALKHVIGCVFVSCVFIVCLYRLFVLCVCIVRLCRVFVLLVCVVCL